MSETIAAVRNEVKQLEGLMTCNLELHIARATADYQWTGPQIRQELWWQVLAFFEWTYATSKSESQVRMFVNNKTREWAAWAFPQGKGTGMTTQELPEHPRFSEQRAKFGDADGWFYYCTVHHHCSAGAFQSSTDERDEHDQDGLHITVGKIGNKHYDIDCRLYQSKWKIAPDMNQFWNIGDFIKARVPDNMHGVIARHQMCIPPPFDYAFPQEWRDNYISPTPPPVVERTVIGGSHWSDSRAMDRMFADDRVRLPSDIKYDREKACEQLVDWLEENQGKVSFAEAGSVLSGLSSDPLLVEICRLLWLHDVSPLAFADTFDQMLASAELKSMQSGKPDNGLVGDGNPLGMDDFYGHSMT